MLRHFSKGIIFCNGYVEIAVTFSKFLVNANFDVLTYYTLRKPNIGRFQFIDMLSKQKSYQVFSHESDTFFYYECIKIPCKLTRHQSPRNSPFLI